ncbi:hypothetical protein TRVL_03850 [Trypanosoma vivax]|nr:hypothetical protein TRVL_03850 [Trypanosoma vivax]
MILARRPPEFCDSVEEYGAQNVSIPSRKILRPPTTVVITSRFRALLLPPLSNYATWLHLLSFFPVPYRRATFPLFPFRLFCPFASWRHPGDASSSFLSDPFAPAFQNPPFPFLQTFLPFPPHASTPLPRAAKSTLTLLFYSPLPVPFLSLIAPALGPATLLVASPRSWTEPVDAPFSVTEPFSRQIIHPLGFPVRVPAPPPGDAIAFGQRWGQGRRRGGA